MRHINYILSPAKLNNAKPQAKPYKLADGGGLFVRVSAAGTRTWCYGYAFGDKRQEVTFGQYPEVGVKEARDRHMAAREQLAAGVNPAASKKEEKEARKRAAGAVEGVFKTFAATWMTECLADATEPYRQKITERLALHINPFIGKKLLEDVKPRDVLAIMESLRDRPPTAEKVRGLLKQVFDHAIRKLLIESNPAAAMKGVVKVPAAKHHTHLTEVQLGAFWRSVTKYSCTATADPSVIAAAQIIALTLCRKSEVTGAFWTEFDLDKGLWTIPAERMKMRKPHRVYLSRQAIAILKEQKTRTGGEDLVFRVISRTRKQPLSATTIATMFRRLEGVPRDFSPHGLRGTGATILREHGFRRDVVELLLSHVEKGVAGAYHHHELAEERRVALQHYADLIDSLAAGAEVIGLGRKRAA
ncbi:tyrosine-type recombinase/integrase [Paraburkholderia caribensis]|uniref:tyrosine-type recombinase/integrase n=1 Tax=Paraburkholderia caribensis TaxID=75105 RepID=UPI001CAFBBE3|nr:integrase arm-type DNA-binding domain-containing protein [Paraburkholderia caribensis]CAG9250028.1 putative Prophage integrase IntZ [Paraburkholderia caribensis]